MIDGLTSVMFSQAQAYVADINRSSSSSSSSLNEKKRVGDSLSRFQGLSVGLGYVIGTLSGSLLMANFGIKSPLFLGISLLVLSSLLIALYLPETVQRKSKQIKYTEANPLGALVLLTRNHSMIIMSISYFFLNLSIAGIQVIWFNYLDHKFHWSIVKNASTLVIQYLLISIMPRMLNRIVGPSNVIITGLLIHSIASFVLANANSEITIFLTMILLSAGISASPSLLGSLTDKVNESETGALQGSVDTIRTISVALAHPIISKIFANTMNTNLHDNNTNTRLHQWNPFYVCSILSFIAFSVYAIEWKNNNNKKND